MKKVINDYHLSPINQKPSTKLIGLTGGIGSGKTSVAKIIEEQDFPVYYSDIRAKEIVNDNAELKAKIIALLGENAYDEQGNYYRKWVAEQIFNDDAKRLALNNIIHPAVKQDFEYWVENQTAKLIFKETALLFELGLDKNCDASVLVTASKEIRIKRVMERDNKTKDEVLAIIKKQMPEEEKRQKANYVIENNMDWEALTQKTKEILAYLCDY